MISAQKGVRIMKWKGYPVSEQIRIKEMFSFFKIHYKNDFEFQGEAHDFWECLYVISGSLCVSADERVYNLKTGDIIFHKPLEFHKFYITAAEGAEILVFSFSMEGLLTDFFANKVFRLSAGQMDIVAEMVEYIEYKQRINERDNNVKTGYSASLELFVKYPVCLQNTALNICRLMLSLAEDSTVGKTSVSPETIIFSKAVDYMNDKIYENPSIEAIAVYCNISVSSLKRIFTKFAGIGVHKYFLLLKLKEAKKMLYRGDSVGNVAETLGFSSQAYFSKTYKREMGISPSAENR